MDAKKLEGELAALRRAVEELRRRSDPRREMFGKSEAAQKLGISAALLTRLHALGQVRMALVGRRWKVSAEEIERVKREGAEMKRQSPTGLTGSRANAAVREMLRRKRAARG